MEVARQVLIHPSRWYFGNLLSAFFAENEVNVFTIDFT
jgi:hypothetical protein